MTDSIALAQACAEIQQRCEAAAQMIRNLCLGNTEWTMRVPAQPDDPDLTIDASLRDIPYLLQAITVLVAELDVLKAERKERSRLSNEVIPVLVERAEKAEGERNHWRDRFDKLSTHCVVLAAEKSDECGALRDALRDLLDYARTGGADPAMLDRASDALNVQPSREE